MGGALTLFKTKVAESYYDKTMNTFWLKCNGWRPRHTDIFDLYVKAGNDWEKVDPSKQKEKRSYQDAWKDIPKEALDYIKSIPEFDAEIFKEITGIDVAKDDGKKTELLNKAQELIDTANELKEQAGQL